MSSYNQKWSSFDEMYGDLKKDPIFLRSIKNDLSQKILNSILEIENASSSKEMFDATCKLTSFFEKLDKDTTHDVYKKTNVYVLVLNAVFHNSEFIKILVEVSSKKENISELKKISIEFEKLIFINTAVLLAFLGIAIDHQSINEESIEFLRKNTTDLLKNIIRNSGYKIDFIDLCFFLEKVSWDNGLAFNQNYSAKYPIKLDSGFLFNNLRTSRSFAGVTLVSLIIRPAIERRFRDVISTIDEASISRSLDSVYQVSHEVNEKIKHYYRTAPKDITGFFDVFVRPSERNLVFCFEKFCSGFHTQEKQKSFFEIILDKLNSVPELKKELTKYTKENFSAFNSKMNSGDQWTNKIFLISIKTLSLLDEIKDARDQRWATNVTIHELYQWMKDIHEVLNRYYLEDDWEKIKDMVSQESESLEWKSSFFTPTEQVFTDEQEESIIRERMFGKIVKVILAMLNTGGGTLVVGIVENPAAVKRDEVKEFLIYKNNTTFFDVSSELKKHNTTLDHVRLKILEKLKNITDNSVDEFNNLIEFEPVVLRNNEKVAAIVKISIKKAKKPFFNVQKENGLVWVSLTRRAHGCNVDVDIRKHI